MNRLWERRAVVLVVAVAPLLAAACDGPSGHPAASAKLAVSRPKSSSPTSTSVATTTTPTTLLPEPAITDSTVPPTTTTVPPTTTTTMPPCTGELSATIDLPSGAYGFATGTVTNGRSDTVADVEVWYNTPDGDGSAYVTNDQDIAPGETVGWSSVLGSQYPQYATGYVQRITYADTSMGADCYLPVFGGSSP